LISPNSKIVVTGGSGFIGTRLIDLLRNKFNDIVIIDKKKSEKHPELVKITDIRDKNKLIDTLMDTRHIFHLAAEHRDDVSPASLYYDVNVEGTANLINAAEKNGIKNIIFTSSVAVYGLNRKEPDEKDSVMPFGDYGKSKWQAEQLLRKWQEEEAGRSLTIIRPVVVFGENNRGNVYNLLKQIISGKFIKIGSGNNKKSMAYVGNVAQYLASLVEDNPGYNLRNYADKPDLTMNEFVQLVYKTSFDKSYTGFSLPYPLGMLGGYIFDGLSFLSRKPFSISSLRIKKFCATTQFSAKKVKSTGFTPDISLVDGIKNLAHQKWVSVM